MHPRVWFRMIATSESLSFFLSSHNFTKYEDENTIVHLLNVRCIFLILGAVQRTPKDILKSIKLYVIMEVSIDLLMIPSNRIKKRFILVYLQILIVYCCFGMIQL